MAVCWTTINLGSSQLLVKIDVPVNPHNTASSFQRRRSPKVGKNPS
jgi:hypothetical protein